MINIIKRGIPDKIYTYTCPHCGSIIEFDRFDFPCIELTYTNNTTSATQLTQIEFEITCPVCHVLNSVLERDLQYRNKEDR